MRILVLDAYPREAREALRAAGGTEAGALYRGMLQRIDPALEVDVLHPADPDAALPSGAALADFAGAAWTGSSLSIHHERDPRVRRQVELARALLQAGVPGFGSCWAAQLAVVAAGGACAPNPRGREFGVARAVALSDAGRAHPLFRGKPAIFDAFTSHADEVVTLPPGATLLASNDFTRVQAVHVRHGRASFQALQYHPEYDPREVAALCRLRREELVAQGRFESAEAADRYAAGLEALCGSGVEPELAAALPAEAALVDEGPRTLEVRNWLEAEVYARRSSDGSGEARPAFR